MKLTRRQCLCLGAGLVLTSFSPAYSGVLEEMEWRIVCRRWMQILLPDDEHGPGADTPLVWSRLEARMDSDPAVKRWLLMGFGELARVETPPDDRKLKALLDEGTSLARFLNLFRIELIESYYSTANGWRDLGFNSPPLS